MEFIADLHLHSKYARATSPQADLEHFVKWAKIKGVKVLGTGDFTHPEWFRELKEKLEEAEPGLYKLKSEEEIRFMLTSEISCIYSKNGRVRKIHILIFAPSFSAVEKINRRLSWVGNLKADGRPILGLDVEELAKIVFNLCPECLVVPAHMWTPWFSLFGSRSGFDSLEECFGDYTKYIFAGETGLSSDPPMNWRWSALDKITLISNSDAHSAPHIGREANVFETDLSYSAITEAIKAKDPKKFLYTIEFFPQEGRYHYDGHRNCGISLSPQETKKYKGICPVCGKPLTIGVLNRVDQLADRPEGFRPRNAIPYKSLVPLPELIASVLAVGVNTKKVKDEYNSLLEKFGSEFNILLNVPLSTLKSGTMAEIAEGIIRAREGKVRVEPGYDGVYGKVEIFSNNEKRMTSGQKSLF